MTRSLTAALAVVLAPAGGSEAFAHAASPNPTPGTAPAAKFALLVGCTEYPNAPTAIRPLRGPANDIPAWAKTLTEPTGFAFPKENVTQLVGWDKDNPTTRPTRANIVAGFEALIRGVNPGAQVVIVLCGHGTQYPVLDPLDPKNPEPDGLDEVFLPADTKVGDGFPENGIKDDDIGTWLDALRAKGASVWIVFDCCHSGTMTRDVGRQAGRLIDPTTFCKPDQISEAIRRAKAAVKAAEAKGDRPQAAAAEEVRLRGAVGTGSVVAFYAAQPYELALDLPLPDGVDADPGNYYGLLSYSILHALRQRQSPVSYRDLSWMVSAYCREVMPVGGPTPFAEGGNHLGSGGQEEDDLDQGVLGLAEWPRQADAVLEKVGGKLRVSAGGLQGLTPRTILAVYPPAGAAGDAARALGHVTVETVAPTTAEVRVVAHGGGSAVDADSLPPLARCEVVERDYGDLKVRLAADPDPTLNAVLAELPREIQAMFVRSDASARADWTLRVVTEGQAAEEFGLRLQTASVLLCPGHSLAPPNPEDAAAEKTAGERLNEAGGGPRKVFGVYPVTDAKALTDSLSRDLPKVFRWQNVWRVAGGLRAQKGGNAYGLELDVVCLRDGADPKSGVPLGRPTIVDGQAVEFRLRNDGYGSQNLWVAVVYLDSNLGIRVLWSGQVQAGVRLGPISGVMRVPENTLGDSTGPEGVVVFAVPQTDQKMKPEYRFLEQSPLTQSALGETRAVPNTAFERLADAAAYGGTTRSLPTAIPTTPGVVAQSWVLVKRHP